MIMSFTYEYSYQDHEYIIRTMNTMHAQSPAIHSAYTPVSPFLLTLNQSPKDNTGSDITICLTHTCYSCITGCADIEGLS